MTNLDLIIRKLFSIKCMLLLSFAVLMGLSGFLGYIFVSIQNEKSINDSAEQCAIDLVDGLTLLILDRIAIGHRLNSMELYYFFTKNRTLDYWPTVYHEWRPLTTQNMLRIRDLFSLSILSWSPNYYCTVNLFLMAMFFGSFNCTVCNDTINFPDSNCSVCNSENYPIDPVTYLPKFATPTYVNVPFNNSATTYWITGPMSRTRPPWRSTPADRFSFGYSPIVPFLVTTPPMLNLQINAAVLNYNLEPVGLLGKSLLLKFLSDELKNLTSSHKLLIHNGRMFAYEVGNKLLTGASAGGVFRVDGPSLITRLKPTDSPDLIIATAGAKLLANVNRPSTAQAKEYFSVQGEDFICYGKPFLERYGLNWMVAIVLSLTDLFKDINRAEKAQLGITIMAIVLLSIFGSVIVSLALMFPLRHLKREMRSIAELDFDNIDVYRRSIFYEIANIQSLFASMVRNLKLYKPFLPDAIIPTPSMSTANAEPPLLGGPRTHSSTSIGGGGGTEGPSPDGMPGRRITVVGATEFTPGSTSRDDPNGGSEMMTATAASMASFRPTIGSLTPRTASVLLVDFVGFHGLANANEQKLRDLFTDTVSFFTKTVTQQHGLCATPVGDKLMAFWNLRRFRSDHQLLCATTALMVHQYARGLKLSNPEFDFGLTLTCASGFCLFGSLGSAHTRNFTVLSEAIQRCFVMQKLTRLIPAQVLCDAAVAGVVPSTAACGCRLIASLPLEFCDLEIFELIPRPAQDGAGGGASQDAGAGWLFQNESRNFTVGAQQVFRPDRHAACMKHLRAHVESVGNGDALGQWLYQNAPDLAHLNPHPSFGFCLPGSLLFPPDAGQ